MKQDHVTNDDMIDIKMPCNFNGKNSNRLNKNSSWQSRAAHKLTSKSTESSRDITSQHKEEGAVTQKSCMKTQYCPHVISLKQMP